MDFKILFYAVLATQVMDIAWMCVYLKVASSQHWMGSFLTRFVLAASFINFLQKFALAAVFFKNAAEEH
jgi:hypothetical protein